VADFFLFAGYFDRKALGKKSAHSGSHVSEGYAALGTPKQCMYNFKKLQICCLEMSGFCTRIFQVQAVCLRKMGGVNIIAKFF
jgi:hypothetical protein